MTVDQEVVDLSQLLSGGWLPLVVGAVVVLLAAGLLAFRLRRRAPPEPPKPDLFLDVTSLGERPPPVDGPQLECYHLPVRIALVVVAPLGRTGQQPTDEELLPLLEGIVPGLARIYGRDRPEVRRWPPQLSFQGFTRTFFANIRLPGDRGKATPWCSLAGRAEFGGRMFVVGLALRAGRSNSLNEHVVDREGAWLDALRVRSQSA
ncbi:MAG: hypothetical protein U0836_21445 [Pirellulales bacterium]